MLDKSSLEHASAQRRQGDTKLLVAYIQAAMQVMLNKMYIYVEIDSFLDVYVNYLIRIDKEGDKVEKIISA